MDIKTLGTERKNVDSNGLTNVASMGIGAAFAWVLLRWLLNFSTEQQKIQTELMRSHDKKLDRVIELLDNRGE